MWEREFGELRDIDIPRVVQDAHDFDFWRHPVANPEISKIVGEFLDQLVSRKIDFVVVGGIAMLAYVEGRNTRDIDLILALSDLQRVSDLKITFQDPDFARANFRGLQIDVLQTRNKLFDLVRREHSLQKEIEKRKIKIATPEGLVLSKLFALPSLYRQGLFDRVALYETDITMLMQRYPLHRDHLIATLKPFLSETDIDSLQDILNDVERRIRRFREQSSSYK
jgi:Nucleotidyltransferase of unknown function (DUF6036)